MRGRWRSWALLTWASVGLLSLACATQSQQPGAVKQKVAGTLSRDGLVQAAQTAEKQGDWSLALAHYQRAEQQGYPPAARAEVLLTLGRYQDLLEEFAEANDPELVHLSAQALRRTGQVEQAIQHLDRAFSFVQIITTPSSGGPMSLPPAKNVTALDREKHITLQSRVTLLHGELHLELGNRETAEITLGALIARIQTLPKETAPPQLVYAGRAAALVHQHELSNDLYNAAETQLDEQKFQRSHRDLLLYRGALFLEKNDPTQALQIAEEVEKLWPHDLAVRAFLAQMLAETRFDFAAAEQAALQILNDNPLHSGALFLLAGTELRDMNLRACGAYLERGLKTNPRDLDLLSLRAALRFLSEDRDGFEQQLAQIAELSPQNVRPYLVVAEYAEWEHRYPDIEKLMRRASRMDRENAEVRARLGLTLVRSASDAAGVVELNRAYDLDPYNLRVINTLNLYEKVIPTSHVSIERGHFRFRFPKNDAELLLRYVPDLLETAYAQMTQRYGYVPVSPIDIELYASSEQFAVRTSGVPQIGIQGVCFGHKLATVSPTGAPGNLGMVLWHELGHVFHIGLSDYRVPRYLTEGMAEWETMQRQVGWSRELDRELFEVRREGGLPPLSQMSRAFTHARRAEDVAAAYYASGILSEWLMQRYGQDTTVRALLEMGKGRVAHEVVPEVLGATWEQLDSEFDAHLTEKLRPIAVQFTPQRPRDEVTELGPLLKKTPNDPDLRLRLALSLLAEGKKDEAVPILDELHATRDAQALFALIRVALSEENKQKARTLLTELMSYGKDGYELRMLSARLFLAEKDDEQAVQELRAALSFDETAEDVRKMLVDYYRRQAQPKEELEQLRAWAKLSEHDPWVHRRLIEVLLEQGEVKDAMAAAQLAIWVDLAGIETHRWAGIAFARGGNWKQAEFEWESALLCPAEPDQLVRLGQSWTEELQKAGRGSVAAVKTRIAAAVDRALKEQLSAASAESNSSDE